MCKRFKTYAVVGLGLVRLLRQSASPSRQTSSNKGKTVTIPSAFPPRPYDLFAASFRATSASTSGQPDGDRAKHAGSRLVRGTQTGFSTSLQGRDRHRNRLADHSRWRRPSRTRRALQCLCRIQLIGRATSNYEVQVSGIRRRVRRLMARRLGNSVCVLRSGSPSETYPKLLNALFGTKYKIIRGYTGSTAGLLAMERGEVDAR